MVCKKNYYFDMIDNIWIHEYDINFNEKSKLNRYSKGPKFRTPRHAIAALPPEGGVIHQLHIELNRVVRIHTWMKK